MNVPTWLIDTNVLIGLEDDHVLKATESEFSKLTQSYGVTVMVHEAGLKDIARDSNSERQAVTRSKYDKYPAIRKIRHLDKATLELSYGPVRKDNDEVDCRHLHALAIGVAEALITEDEGLHSRARKHAPEVANSVFRLSEAVAHLKILYGEKSVGLRHIAAVEAHELDTNDAIFDSLREGYPDFDYWWKSSCIAQRRNCWVVYDDDTIGGVIVRKDETRADTDAVLPGTKIMKICTFKVRPASRGHSLGEHLLKQALWHCKENDYDLTYLTTYAQQTSLIGLLKLYGFAKTKVTKCTGELVFEKSLTPPSTVLDEDETVDAVFARYPNFLNNNQVEAFGIPIREPFHDILFPELNTDNQRNLFEITPFQTPHMKPGNTIRKVYICNAVSNLGPPGSLLFFYKGVSNSRPSQAVTAFGILESVQSAKSVPELVTRTGGRSVYSEHELNRFAPSATRPAKVINFLLGGYIQPAIQLPQLRDIGVVRTRPQQSIYRLSLNHRNELLKNLSLSLEQSQ